MPSATTFKAWADSLDAASYYQILRVAPNAPPEQIKDAFYALALRCHPDRFVGEGEDVVSAAAEVFKRTVEAYRVLGKPDSRASYDQGLARGHLRYEEKRTQSAPPTAEPLRTLEAIAGPVRAKEFARKADRMLSFGKLEEARVALAGAVQWDPDNDELKERLQMLYEALALEPG